MRCIPCRNNGVQTSVTRIYNQIIWVYDAERDVIATWLTRHAAEELPNSLSKYYLIILTNSMAYGTRSFNAAFTRALQ